MSGGLVIRPYRSSDDAGLAAIDGRIATEATWLPLLLRAHAARGLLVAERDGAIAGYIARTFEFFDKDFIALVVVDDAQRRRGIGAALMRAVEAISRQDRIFTSTNRSNAPMQAMLERIGYVASGRIDNLDPGDPELVFVKFLHR